MCIKKSELIDVSISNISGYLNHPYLLNLKFDSLKLSLSRKKRYCRQDYFLVNSNYVNSYKGYCNLIGLAFLKKKGYNLCLEPKVFRQTLAFWCGSDIFHFNYNRLVKSLFEFNATSSFVRFFVGSFSHIKDRCVSVSESYMYQSKICPHMVGCGSPVMREISTGWFSEIYICLGFTHIHDSRFIVGRIVDLIPDAKRVLPNLYENFFVKDDHKGLVAYVPKLCENKDFLYSEPNFFQFVEKNQHLCIRSLPTYLASNCSNFIWMDFEIFSKFLISDLPLNYSNHHNYLNYLAMYSGPYGLKYLYDGIFSNCTLKQYKINQNCIFYFNSSLKTSFVESSRCFSVHLNRHNWFTTLILSVIHAILSPFIDLLEGFYDLVLSLFYELIFRYIGDTIFITFVISTLIIFLYTRNWIFSIVSIIIVYIIFIFDFKNANDV